MSMRLVCLASLLLAGCVKVMPPDEVVRQVHACNARGGVTVIQTVDRYSDAVKWVTCYLPEPQK